MRILVPVEGTPECEEPISLAQQLASAADAEIYLLRVIEVPGGLSPFRSGHDITRMMDDAVRYLSELASRVELPEDRTRRVVREGLNVASEIITFAEIEGMDLIIMASHCRGWLGRLAQGSVCSEVMRSRVCPVLCVPLPRTQAGHRQHAMTATRP
ncbi:MAG: universal stress protein [Dehalococcoidia bacterium]|nr:MAG: universal stress protein [Dehalococcoidia bacterium]